MSDNWSFQSFSQSKFDAILGSNNPDAEHELVEAVTWDEWGDMETIERLARGLVKHGAIYDNMSQDDAETLDEVIAMLFSPEGLEQQLEVEYESPDGLHPSIVKEMVERASGGVQLSLLPLLSIGRRLGQLSPAKCQYCIFSIEEVKVLRSEVEQVIALPGAWSEDYVPEVIEECLRSVLVDIEAKGKSMMGVLS